MSVIGNLGGLVPGMGTVRTETQTVNAWNAHRFTVFDNGQLGISSTASDAGNTPTTTLRAGLPLGIKTSDGLMYAWDPTATDGTQKFYGFLPWDVPLYEPTLGANAARYLAVQIGGYVRTSTIVGPTAAQVKLLKAQARRGGRFIFDDDVPGLGACLYPVMSEVAKTADYTVLATDNGTLFTNTGAAGAVVFTLPTLAPGLAFEFLLTVDQDVTVTSAAGDDLVVPNDAAADTVAFKTPGDRIGGYLGVFANAAGSKWYVRRYSGNALTITT